MDAAHARAVAAEAAGAFFMVLAGGGAILAGADHLAVALAFGLAVAALVYALGHVSGAHLNPAITLAFAATGHFPWRLVPAYATAQVVGATAASLLLAALVPGPVDSLAVGIAPGVGLAGAVAVEALATAMLAFVILAVATDRRAAPAAAGLAIGFAVLVGALWAGPLSGGAMNPARALGPALAAGDLRHAWVWLVGPVAGAVAGMAGYEALRGGRKPAKAAEAELGALGPVDGADAA